MVSNYKPADYIPLDSSIHQMDPRSKMSIVLAYIIAAFVAAEAMQILLLTVLLFILLIFSRIPLKQFWQGIGPFLFIIIITALVQIFMIKGTHLISWHFISVSQEGLRLGILLAIRLLLIIIIARWLLMTTSYLELIAGLEKLLFPLAYLRIPVNELIMVMGIALKFIPLLEEEAIIIRDAQAARGANWHNANLAGKLKFWLALLVPLLTAVFQRADELSQAMESRGFNPGEPRTRLVVLKMNRIDYMAISISILSLLAICSFV